MSSSLNSSGSSGTSDGDGIRNIRTNRETLLRIEDDAVLADEELYNSHFCHAQFFVDSTILYGQNSTHLVYRFRPRSQPRKFLDVSGGHVVLTDIPCENTSGNFSILCQSSHNFIPDIVNGELIFRLRPSVSSTSSEPLYMSINEDDQVIVSPFSHPFLLDEPPESTCDALNQSILFSEMNHLDVELDVKNSRPAHAKSCPHIVRMWREEMEASRAKVSKKKNLLQKIRAFFRKL